MIAAGIGAVCAAIEWNPNEQDYLDAIRHRQTMMAIVPRTSRNDDAAELLQRLGTLQASSQVCIRTFLEGDHFPEHMQIYRINCVVASIFVEARCSDSDCTYASNNSFVRDIVLFLVTPLLYLQVRPRYREYLTTRLLDVGAFGHFYRLTTAFDWQYDVPYNDFNAKQELPQFVDFVK